MKWQNREGRRWEKKALNAKFENDLDLSTIDHRTQLLKKVNGRTIMSLFNALN